MKNARYNGQDSSATTAKLMNIYKNTKHNLLKSNTAIWFNTKTGVAYKERETALKMSLEC
jgi:hypothetical protein